MPIVSRKVSKKIPLNRRPLVDGAKEVSDSKEQRYQTEKQKDADEHRKMLLTTVPCFVIAALLLSFLAIVGYDRYTEMSGNYVLEHHHDGLKYRGYLLPPTINYHGEHSHLDFAQLAPPKPGILPSLIALDKQDPMDTNSEKPYLVIGLTGRLKQRNRESGLGSFLHITVVDLMERLTPSEIENKEVLVVVLVSNQQRHHKKGLAKHLKKHCKYYIDMGVLQIISPGPSYYQDLIALEKTGHLTDGSYAEMRRTLDVAYLMQYCYGKGSMYLQLHEDTVVQKGYVKRVRKAHSAANEHGSWNALSLAEGTNNGVFFGYALRCSDLHFMSYYLQTRFEESTIDYLVRDMFRAYDHDKMVELFWDEEDFAGNSLSEARLFNALFPYDPIDMALDSRVFIDKDQTSIAQHVAALVRQSHGKDLSRAFDITLWMKTRGEKIQNLVK